jgi:hypothetical protein
MGSVVISFHFPANAPRICCHDLTGGSQVLSDLQCNGYILAHGSATRKKRNQVTH